MGHIGRLCQLLSTLYDCLLSLKVLLEVIVAKLVIDLLQIVKLLPQMLKLTLYLTHITRRHSTRVAPALRDLTILLADDAKALARREQLTQTLHKVTLGS